MKTLVETIHESHKVLLWIDDLRDPKESQWKRWIKHHFDWYNANDIVWVKSYDEFIAYMNKYGLPNMISFDHDLGDVEWDLDGYDCCKYIVDYCQRYDIDIPDYAIQSANPVGEQDIRSLMNNYHKFYMKMHK